ncbi:MAG TPA: type I restriction endonuclease [Bryobacteraceae bacterium]|jgi:type I restriction enzyme R subunit|nr:type I restriction endonuclease [Bryobacteraceae bacterium]
MVDHREIAFEEAIEHSLLTAGGYERADPAAYDRTRALHPEIVLDFVRGTQPRGWKVLTDYYGANAADAFLTELVHALDARGTLDVLRHGLDFFGQTFALAYFAPASGMNPETAKLYRANGLTVTRQLHFSVQHEQSVDLLLSVNGLPVATAELKNAFTGQTVNNAIAQYRGRDHREPLFAFKKRALVHFAVDTDTCYMTTRLEGEETRFLPFNRGNGKGAGNPENPNGYRTFYLWEQIWQRDSWLDLLGRFLHVDRSGKQETLIFPRYHQVDAVRKLTAGARASGPGKNYLVWHSAGSGKSNSIAWLAHRLSSLHDAQDRKVFDSVVVLTDRLVLDKQLQDTIYQFEHKTGVVVKIDEDSKQLADALRAGAPIIITILQKFPFVTKHAGDLPERRYAVIVDEAHSSQSGESAARMKATLAGERIREIARKRAAEENLPDYEEEVIRVMEGRKQQPNLSFFAFTATPKYKTIEIFGQRDANGEPQPFHEYSMRQAIEEGFILDVLKNYTVYSTYYGLLKAAQDDPEVEKKKAAKALARFMRLHPHNIAQKTEVIVEHFRQNVRHRVGGRAKAMVVTGSRLEAVRYKRAADEYIRAKQYNDLRTLVAFSGSLVDPDDPTGEELTEVKMNGGKISEKQLPEEFKKREYGILIVADKYQTGFDQPLLHTMYVDKRLADVQAVQTLSRLNRVHPGKEDTFVLDFVNAPEEIQRAFQRYYDTAPLVTGKPDPRQLYNLRAELYATFLVQEIEVEQFAAVFFKPRRKESPTDNALMNSIVDKAVARFGEAPEQDQEEFRGRLESFRRLYSFLSQVIPFGDSKLEKLDAYLRFLESKLLARAGTCRLDLDQDVRLKYYRLQKISEGRIALEAGVPGTLKGPSDVGTGRAEDEQVPLSRVVDVLNERFGTEFTERDELFWEQVRADAAADESVRDAGEANTIDNFAHVFDRKLEEIVIERMDRNSDQVVRFLDNPEMRECITRLIRNQVYARIRQQSGTHAAEV